MDLFVSSSKSAQALISSNQSSSLQKCQVIVPKGVEQSIVESEKRVNR